MLPPARQIWGIAFVEKGDYGKGVGELVGFSTKDITFEAADSV